VHLEPQGLIELALNYGCSSLGPSSSLVWTSPSRLCEETAKVPGSNPGGPTTLMLLELGSKFKSGANHTVSGCELPAGRKPRDLSLLNGKATKLFLEAIRSPVTQEVYSRRLATFLEHVGMDVDRFVRKAKAQPKWAQETIMNYLLKEKEREAISRIRE